MPSNLLWPAAPASGALEANGASLADGTIVEANDIAGGYDVIATGGGKPIGWLKFTGTWSVAPSAASPSISIYAAQSLDGGTSYQDAPVTGGVDCGHTFICSIPIRKVTTAQVMISRPVALDPGKIKFYVDNKTGQSLGAGWTLTLYLDNLQGS